MRSVTDIQNELNQVLAAISKTLLAQEYSFDTGQTKQGAKRSNLNELRQLQYSLQSELSVATNKQNNTQLLKGRIGC